MKNLEGIEACDYCGKPITNSRLFNLRPLVFCSEHCKIQQIEDDLRDYEFDETYGDQDPDSKE